jgi:type I restriction enzyme S subunit
MTEFHQTKLGDMLTFQRGFDITKSEQNEGTVPIVSSSGISSYHNKAKVKGPGVVIGRKGTLGTVHFLKEDFWPHDTTLWIKDFKGNCPRFLSYFMPALKLENFDVGAANPTLNRNHVHGIKVVFPRKRKLQERIAAILSAYDELIETNQRRIALLEKLAEQIYREWFVRLRFPGHEKVKKIKGVPEGWRVAELRELAKVNPSSISRQNKPENILYVDISSVSTNRIEGITPYAFNDAPGRARRRVEHGDVIWSSVRPANRAYSLIFDPPENLIVSTGFAVIRPNKKTPFTFLFFAVTSNSFVDQMTAVAKGAAYPATSFDDFEKAKLLVPTDGLLSGFHDVAEPLFRQKHLLQEQNTHLTRTRDLLLPRLISGKLSVEDLDIQFPPGMEEGRDRSPQRSGE